MRRCVVAVKRATTQKIAPLSRLALLILLKFRRMITLLVTMSLTMLTESMWDFGKVSGSRADRFVLAFTLTFSTSSSSCYHEHVSVLATRGLNPHVHLQPEIQRYERWCDDSRY
ncbi:uncharacterized protein LOC135166256 [Diachasmimorpha longicaudata]|uniref:uncharacterized protein LOC135166256 n=1 Tax=Diachasmimorpha longicaudata TaxID=58733 RepID=UPI0030B8FC0F